MVLKNCVKELKIEQRRQKKNKKQGECENDETVITVHINTAIYC